MWSLQRRVKLCKLRIVNLKHRLWTKNWSHPCTSQDNLKRLSRIYSTFFSAAQLFNSLPAHIRNCANFNELCRETDSFLRKRWLHVHTILIFFKIYMYLLIYCNYLLHACFKFLYSLLLSFYQPLYTIYTRHLMHYILLYISIIVNINV